MAGIPFISVLPCQTVVRCAVAHGVTSRDFCSSAGIDDRALDDRDGRVPISAYYALLERLADRTKNPHIGLAVPRHAAPDDYGLLGFLFLSSASVGEAFDRMLRYQRLVGDPTLSMEIKGARAIVRYELWGPRRPAHDHVGDAFAAETVLGLQMLCGERPQCDLRLSLKRAATDPDPYQAQLDVTPGFDQLRLELSLDARVLGMPVQKSDPALAGMLEHQAEIMLRLLPPPRRYSEIANRPGSRGPSRASAQRCTSDRPSGETSGPVGAHPSAPLARGTRVAQDDPR
ncbi:MAG: AraC family transcriptional regulator ligand-binding domain-containing protein [Nannocystaceae bacterium]